MTESVLAQIAATQSRANRNSLPQETNFAEHRRHLTAAVLAAVPPAPALPRLALLGAGYALDVDLPALAAAFEVHLVDLDPVAVAAARDRIPEPLRQRIVIHAPVDISGLLDRGHAWLKKPPTTTELETHVIASARTVARSLPGPFDVVASTCLVTQLSLSWGQILGAQNALLPAVRAVQARIHLHTLAQLLPSGGRAIVATDFVSNQTYPLETIDSSNASAMNALVTELVRTENFLAGADPFLWQRPLRRDAALAAAFDPPTSLTPWIWTLSPALKFLVTAFMLQRRG